MGMSIDFSSLSGFLCFCPDIPVKKTEELLTTADYLHRGQVIQTCVRKKTQFNKPARKMLYDILKKHSVRKKSGYQRAMYVEEQIMRSIIRPICNKVVSDYEATGKLDAAPFLELFEPEIGMRLEMADDNEQGVLESLYKKEILKKGIRLKCVSVTSALDGDTYCCPLNVTVTSRRHGKGYYLRSVGESGAVTVGDIGLASIFYVIQSEVLRYLKKILKEERKENRVWNILYRKVESVLCAATDSGVVWIQSDAFTNDVKSFIEENDIPYKITDDKAKNALRRSSVAYFKLLKFHPVSKDCTASCVIRDMWMELLDEMLKDMDSEVFRKNLSDKATVWMTKKNIPDKMVRHMQQSGFNKYFGYVEFDESCDIAALKEIESEWEALQGILQAKKYDHVAIRFRKLGNYRASGLYFPDFHCLCVDIRVPSSMVHEYFHLLDFENGELSRKESFRKVEILYKMVLNETMNSLPKGDPVKEQWNGHTKYNKSYYFEPTEIFARCGEMYMTRICGVNNSLCVPSITEGFAYPQDESLIEEVARYFDLFFKKEAGEEVADDAKTKFAHEG